MSLADHLRALGADGLPEQIEREGRVLGLERVFQHNSLAAVGLYGDGDERIVLKCYRRAHLFGVPMVWLGSLMARYEAAVMHAVHDLQGVPRLLGTHGPTGLLKEYVQGEPLTRHTKVDRRFFRQFFRLLRSIHRRGIAYVDLEKAENIMLGEDGRPYLIDFQVAFYVPERLGGRTWPARLMRRMLQRADMYHARKHFRRLLRDQLSPRQIACLRRKPWFVRFGNLLHAPYKKLRRWLLA